MIKINALHYDFIKNNILLENELILYNLNTSDSFQTSIC